MRQLGQIATGVLRVLPPRRIVEVDSAVKWRQRLHSGAIAGPSTRARIESGYQGTDSQRCEDMAATPHRLAPGFA
ncbi:hypothetical protein GCM10009765_48420 [Fodinicola feengrottensis]|uniref:Uncharacterized protein n=1 Tax=Fodinicola feengrottensis TaxID=435914 RepID=A0ABN2HTW4_9ACTN